MSTRVTRTPWTAVQGLALAVASALVVGLWIVPDMASRVLWGGVIPLLPALLLLHPGLWRNVCPLASLNMAAARLGRPQRMSPRATRALNTIGIGLFLTLVPLRGVVFDVNGHATAVAILAFAAMAVVGGAFFDRKAGYCNAICPLLAIERLYGHAPAVGVSNPRCPTCTLCVRRGCIDLSGPKSVAQTLGPRRRTAAWVREPFGAFAAAFPGFVVAFFLIPPGATAYAAYGAVAVGAAASSLLAAGIVRRFDVPAARATTFLAAAALLAFYWFTGARVAETWNGGVPVAWSVRGAALAVGIVWYVRRTRRVRGTGRPRRSLASPISRWGSATGPSLSGV